MMAVWNTASGLPLILKAGTTSYIPGPNGLPLEQVTGSGSVYYYHADQIGNTRALTDSTGTIQDTWSYDPYGNVTSSTGTVVNPFQFQGQYLDPTSALLYLRARWYDATTAQFMLADPAKLSTRQPYVFVGDNAVNLRDASGLWSFGFDVSAAVEWAIGLWTGGGNVELGRQLVQDTSNPDEGLNAAPEADIYSAGTTPSQGGDDQNLAVGAFAGVGLGVTATTAQMPQDIAGTYDTWQFQIALGALDVSFSEGFKEGQPKVAMYKGGAKLGIGCGVWFQHTKTVYQVVPNR